MVDFLIGLAFFLMVVGPGVMAWYFSHRSSE